MAARRLMLSSRAHAGAGIREPDEPTQVLIVGGGIVGLTASLLLHHQGVRSLLVERHPGTSILPRSRGLHTRSMEILRMLGLEEAVRAAGAGAIKQGTFGGAFSGPTLVEAQSLWESAPPGATAFRPWARLSQESPTSFCFCPQDELEPVLRASALGRGCDLRFNTELVALEIDESGVTAATLDREREAESVVRADYLIAADGARSPVREALGIPCEVTGVPEHFLNIYFRADLAETVRERTFSQCEIANGDLRGLLVSLNNTDRWTFHLSYDPAKIPEPDGLSAERCVELLRKALGLPRIEIAIMGTSPWESAARVARRYGEGRVFLAGDAAHLMPPWGGFGANTGIADAHNLAWKLAATLRGEAGPPLLESYEAERRPVGLVAARQAYLRTDFRARYGLATEANADAFRELIPSEAILAGACYASRGVLSEYPRTFVPERAVFDGQPGTRAPHVWIERDGKAVSTLDLFGREWILLASSEGSAWRDAASAAAKETGLALEAFSVGPSGDYTDQESNLFKHRYGLSGEGAVLVRPDGIVAARFDGTPAPSLLPDAVRILLGIGA